MKSHLYLLLVSTALPSYTAEHKLQTNETEFQKGIETVSKELTDLKTKTNILLNSFQSNSVLFNATLNSCSAIAICEEIIRHFDKHSNALLTQNSFKAITAARLYIQDDIPSLIKEAKTRSR